MIEKYHGGIITKTDDVDDLDKKFFLAEQTVADFEAQMEAMELNKALKTDMGFYQPYE